MLLGIYVVIGAAFGALLRWWISLSLNSVFPTMPLGTLTTNLVGGFLIGIILGITRDHAYLSEGMRLMIVTGFLGSLTTFSTFSAETVTLLTTGQYFWTGTIIICHVVGSIIATILGMFLVKVVVYGWS